ncbi:hypothetical protein [Spirosoma areae]
MVEVFKTNVLCREQASTILLILAEQFPRFKLNFDLEDCDKILRVEGRDILSHQIILLVNATGYHCEVLV